MAVAETFIIEAGRLLETACHCPTPELAESMRGLARKFLELAHREAEVCCYPVARIDARGEPRRDGEGIGEVAGRSAESVNSADSTHVLRFCPRGCG
jgi:hypothetical protein